MKFAQYPSLQEKVVLITGGATGIGASLVKHFTLQGSQVAFIDIDDEAAESLCAQLTTDQYARPLYLHCDLNHIPSIKIAIEQAYEVFGNISVLVNNAASDVNHTTSEVTEEQWEELLNINLRQKFFCAQSVIPMMEENGGGSIINMGSSCFLQQRFPSYPCYVIAKSGLIGLTRSLACEFGKKNIRVNSILPGWVMTDRQVARVTPEIEAAYLLDQCLKKRIYPEDVAQIALFLASDDSQIITKQCIIADGGRA